MSGFGFVFHNDDHTMVECPDCGDEQADYDGFGVLHCFKCGFCTHAAITGGVCDLCGKTAETREGSDV
jgi:ribosomal protein S27E